MSNKFVSFLMVSVLAIFSACGEKEQEITVQSIALSQPSAELKIGETLNLKATVSPSNATYDGITWTSTKTSVATVSGSGQVSALAEGNTTITAMAGGKTASCSVTVVKGYVAVSSISLNKDSIELVEGDSETLTATVSPNDATDKTVSWASSNDAVATVKDGTITAVKEGEATITAKAGEKTTSCKVVVAKKVIPVESIELNKTELALVEGDTETLTATISPEDATDKTITWTSSKESVATVKDGVVSAITEGEATITAKAGEKSASCKVVVAKKVIPVESIELNKTELELKKGESSSLTATVLPTNATNPSVSWSSSNSDIAKVDQNGKVNAVGGGEAIITAKAGDKTAECKVSVSIPATSVSLNNSSVEMHPSETIQLVATILPNDMTDNISWSSNNQYVASVDDFGKVSAHNQGITTIAVTVGNVSASCEVKVSANNDDVIVFVDDKVKTRLVARFDNNGDGELSYEEAASVTSIEGVLTIKTITSFDEFQYFTGVTVIPNDCFKEWKLLRSIVLPPSIVSIGESAFYKCSSLTEIIVPEGVTSIGNNAFQTCTSLTKITIPQSLTSLGARAFQDCSSLLSIIIPEGVDSIKWHTFEMCISLVNVQLPDNLTSIESLAFHGCESLKSINIPKMLTNIGEASFGYCPSLTELYIPRYVNEIGDRAFAFCRSLTSIIVDPNNTVFDSREDCNCIIMTTNNMLITGCKHSFIPHSVTSIGPYAFSESGLSSIVIPENVIKIGEYAFTNCADLTSISIPESISVIEKGTFYNCSGLLSISIPISVLGIGSYAFEGCSSLTNIVIPESVTSLGVWAFGSCFRLTSITVLPETPPSGGSDMFYNTNKAPIYVPSGSVDTYKTTYHWKDYASRIQAIQE